MAIQVRRGNERDFDPNKLLPGEWAVFLDTQKVWMCFAPGIVKRLGTYEDFYAQIAEATKDIRDSYVSDFDEIKADIELIADVVSSDKKEVLIIKSDIINTYLPQIKEYVERAETASLNAEVSANNSSNSAMLSESYAVGGTGTRTGEDTDNSKYYSEVAKTESDKATTEADRAKAEADRAQGLVGGDFVTNSQIKEYSLTKDTGYELGLSIDNTTYVMTVQLKNANGSVLSEKTIDFPIESMVIDATYSNGVITLTLQNGTTLPVDVSALVSGLVKNTFTIAGIDMKDNITASELKKALGLNNVANVTVNNQAPTFTKASTRANIASGEKLSVLFGKIKKWLADLTAPAFAQVISSYSDLMSNTVVGYIPDALAVKEGLSKEFYEFNAYDIFPDIASSVYIQDDKLYISLGGYSTQYLISGNYYVVGKIQNITLPGNFFINGSVVDANGTTVVPVSLAVYQNGDITLFTHGVSLSENIYNILNVQAVISL